MSVAPSLCANVAFESEQLANETPRCRLERVGVDLADLDARRELLRNVSARARMHGAPFAFEPQDWFGFFAWVGWRARGARYLPEVGAELGRRAPLP